MTWRFFILCSTLFCCGCSRSAISLPGSSNPTGDRLERTTENGPVKLVVSVTPVQPRLSDIVEMEVQVTADPEVEIKPPAFGQAVGDFLVRDYSEKKERSSAPKSDDATVHRYHYQLEPMHAGRHLIRSLAIEFIDHRATSESRDQPSLIESEPLEVQVSSEFGDTLPDLANLDPMLPPRSLDSSARWNWLTAAVVLGIIALTAWWFRRRRNKQFVEPPKLSPEEIAHAALTALLAEQLPAKGLVKEFYLRLTGIVRQFIEGTTGLRAPEQTTEEFLQAMRTREIFPAERSLRLKDFLEAADMVKYAGLQPDNDQIDQAITRAREFVGATSTPQPVSAGEG